MTLRLKVQTKELKSALGASEAMSKKIPNDITPGDAFAAILRREEGFSLVAAHDYFTTEIKLSSMQQVGTDDEGICVAWDGVSSVGEENVLGIYGINELVSLLAKMTGAAKELVFIFDKDKRRMKIEADGGKEYFIEMSVPRKLLANYRGITTQQLLVRFSAPQFSWFCSTLSALGKIVKPSVAKPGFGCVVLNAFPTDSKPLVLSGNSDSEGYSAIYTSHILANTDFTALLPKNLSEGFSSFLTKMGLPEGDVEFSATLDDAGRASKLFFTSEKFLLSIVCMKDEFPFKALDNIVAVARKPYCTYETARDEIKKAVERLAVFAKNDEAVTEINVLDGGSVEVIQRRNVTSQEKPAREVCAGGVLADFPEKIPALGTSVKTDVLKNTVSLVPATPEMRLVVCESNGNSARRMAFLSSDEFSEITVVLLGLRSDIR